MQLLHDAVFQQPTLLQLHIYIIVIATAIVAAFALCLSATVARTVVLADQCGRVPHLAHSAPNKPTGKWSCRTRNVCGYNPGRGIANVSVAAFKQVMREARVPACGAIDDQWGVMPAHLADLYFLRYLARDSRPGPLGADALAARELARRAERVCAPLLPERGNVPDPENHTICRGKKKSVRCLPLAVEGRLTMRLVKRHVPWLPTPFRFSCPAVNIHLHADVHANKTYLC